MFCFFLKKKSSPASLWQPPFYFDLFKNSFTSWYLIAVYGNWCFVPTRFVLMDGRSWPFYCVHEADVWNVKSSGHWSWDYKHISSSRKFNVNASNIWLGLLIRVFEEFSGTLMSPVSIYSNQSCGVQRSKISSKLL